MKPLFDLHTHTIASGHAYSSLKENIEAAAERGSPPSAFPTTLPPCPAPAIPFISGTTR